MKALLRYVIILCLGVAPAACAGNFAPPIAASEYTVPGQDTEYTLAPGDKIHVIVFGEETLTADYEISSGGNLTFPLIGTLKATDQTVEGLQNLLTAKLSDGWVNNPHITVQVISFRPFYILGEVNKPGQYPIATGLTIDRAVANAGGYTYRANIKRAYIKRANQADERLIYLTKGDVTVHAGDVIRIVERHF